MMDGPQHFEEAERIIATAEDRLRFDDDHAAAIAAVAQVHAMLALAWEKNPYGRRDGGLERVTGASRKLGREWARLRPGVQGRLISFGGINDQAFAWIEVREEPS